MTRNDWTLVGLRLMGVWFLAYGTFNAVDTVARILRLRQETTFGGDFQWIDAFQWGVGHVVGQLAVGAFLALCAPRVMAWFARRDARRVDAARRSAPAGPPSEPPAGSAADSR